MAEVNYMASTSKADEFQEPSVVIIDPKSDNSSTVSSEEIEQLKSDDQNTHPNRPSGEIFVVNKKIGSIGNVNISSLFSSSLKIDVNQWFDLN
jgi:hypothetical protein